MNNQTKLWAVTISTNDLFFATIKIPKILTQMEEIYYDTMEELGYTFDDKLFEEDKVILLVKNTSGYSIIGEDNIILSSGYAGNYRMLSQYTNAKNICMYAYNSTIHCPYDFSKEKELYIKEVEKNIYKSKSNIN